MRGPDEETHSLTAQSQAFVRWQHLQGCWRVQPAIAQQRPAQSMQATSDRDRIREDKGYCASGRGGGGNKHSEQTTFAASMKLATSCHRKSVLAECYVDMKLSCLNISVEAQRCEEYDMGMSAVQLWHSRA